MPQPRPQPAQQPFRPRELDVVSRWLWLLWRVLLFCSLLSSPAPLRVPDGLVRLSQALRSLRRAVPGPWPGPWPGETPYPFRPDDGLRLRPEYQAKHGAHGEALVRRLGGDGGVLKEYLTPPAASAALSACPVCD